MQFIDITEEYKDAFNKSVSHPLQSFEWGEFRKKTGVTVIRRGKILGKKVEDGYTLTLHKVPKLSYTIGYLPKGSLPSKEILEDISSVCKTYNCIYVQLEPNVIREDAPNFKPEKLSLKPSFHPLFTKFTFVLDIEKTEEELLKQMHPKTRYNIKVAQKHGVEIIEDNSEKGFEAFLKLYEETTTRQKFYAHTPDYHRSLWELLGNSKSQRPKTKDELSYHLLHAKLGEEILTSWVLFSFKDWLYYPYGASSREHREAMASNLIMWETIRLGKKLGLKHFDMWGALGTDADPKDPWYGFHKFKQGYGAILTEYVGSYDYVLDPLLYRGMIAADKLRWMFLKMKK
ncbi:MAG: lipid II:glycine glycyltransferase FemX [Candidatus Levyibacteriota bacterium]